MPAYAIAADHPARRRRATRAARRSIPDREPLLVRMGGTLPAAALFERLLGLKTLLFSFSTADENLHAPNEFFRLTASRRAWRLGGAVAAPGRGDAVSGVLPAEGVISFARGIPSPDLLPVAQLEECAGAAIRRNGRVALNYGPPAGYEPLRA